MAHSGLASLRKKFGNECHYCGDKTNGTHRSPKQATREHIVPKAYGGSNNINNYVLACAECNNKRGVQLFYCDCEFLCGPLIRKALESDHFIKTVFDGLIAHNRYKVYKNSEGRWCTRVYHGRRLFDTWAEAMDFALNYEGRAVK